MGDFVIALAGCVCGLAVSWFVVRVAKHDIELSTQGDWPKPRFFFDGFSSPPLLSSPPQLWQRRMMADLLSRAFSVILPMILGILGAWAALSLFGSGEWVHVLTQVGLG